MKTKKSSVNTKRRPNYRILGVVTVCTVMIATAAFVTIRLTTPTMSAVAARPAETRPHFLPTVANQTAPPASVPDGMVSIPGGEFSMAPPTRRP